MIYLTLEDLLTICQRADWGPVRDVGLLESAVRRPATSAFGMDAYPTLIGKAAALLQSLCGNRALVDGTKRLAWTATDVFLRLNDVLEATDDDAESFMMRVAAGTVGLEDIMTWLAKH